MKNIRTIISKEWAEVFKHRMVLFTLVFLPLIFMILPLATLYFTGQGMEGLNDTSAGVPVQFLSVCGDGMSGGECLQVYVINQFLLMFMMMPKRMFKNLPAIQPAKPPTIMVRNQPISNPAIANSFGR